MSDRDELEALRRLAELEAKAGGQTAATPRPPVEPPNWIERQLAKLPDIVSPKEESQLRGIAMGAADPSVGLFQLGANLVGAGAPVNQAVSAKEAQYQAERAQAGREGFDAYRTAGNVISPTTLLPISRLAPAATLPGRVAQGVAVSGAAGLATPVTSGGDFAATKTEQGLTSAALGGGLPIVGAIGRSVGGALRDTADLIIPGGAKRILDRYQSRILGKDGVKEAILAAEQAGAPFVGPSMPGQSRGVVGEIVPGNVPTTAEALAGVPSASPIMAHQAIVAKTPGGISGQFGQRALDQRAANAAAMAPIAQTPDALATAVAQRAANSAQRYGAAYAQAIKADPELAQLASDPYFQKALPAAFDLAKSKGVDPKTDLTQFLHYVKIGLDKQLLPNAKDALAGTEKEAVAGARERLIDWMGRKNPLYEAARAGHAAESQPINAMQVGQAIERKMVNPSGNETPGTFLNAVADETRLLKSATGRPYPVFTPEQQRVVDALAQTQERKLASMNPPQRTDLQGGVNVAEETRTHLPNLLSRPAMIANWLMKLAAGKGSGIEGRVDQLAAERYLDPAKFAADLKAASPSQRQMLIEAILRRAQPATLSTLTQGIARLQGNEQ